MLTIPFLYTAYVYPTTKSLMNYNSVILVGILVITTIWWLVHARRNYPGPKLMVELSLDAGTVVDERLPREKKEE